LRGGGSKGGRGQRPSSPASWWGPRVGPLALTSGGSPQERLGTINLPSRPGNRKAQSPYFDKTGCRLWQSLSRRRGLNGTPRTAPACWPVGEGLFSSVMSEVTRILSAIEQGDLHAAEKLLPLVYDELRRLAARKLAREKPGQTLGATGLVHEAYLRLVGGGQERPWESRGHFFAAAAEAMRRILVRNARRKTNTKHGAASPPPHRG